MWSRLVPSTSSQRRRLKKDLKNAVMLSFFYLNLSEEPRRRPTEAQQSALWKIFDDGNLPFHKLWTSCISACVKWRRCPCLFFLFSFSPYAIFATCCLKCQLFICFISLSIHPLSLSYSDGAIGRWVLVSSISSPRTRGRELWRFNLPACPLGRHLILFMAVSDLFRAGKLAPCQSRWRVGVIVSSVISVL